MRLQSLGCLQIKSKVRRNAGQDAHDLNIFMGRPPSISKVLRACTCGDRKPPPAGELPRPAGLPLRAHARADARSVRGTWARAYEARAAAASARRVGLLLCARVCARAHAAHARVHAYMHTCACAWARTCARARKRACACASACTHACAQKRASGRNLMEGSKEGSKEGLRLGVV